MRMDSYGQPYVSPEKCAILRHYQRQVYGITFVAYLCSHFSRKIYTNVRPQMIADGMSLSLLGTLDSTFMVPSRCLWVFFCLLQGCIPISWQLDHVCLWVHPFGQGRGQ